MLDTELPVSVTRRLCLRCGHIWLPRTALIPAVCPKSECKSPYWNRARVREGRKAKG